MNKKNIHWEHFTSRAVWIKCLQYTCRKTNTHHHSNLCLMPSYYVWDCQVINTEFCVLPYMNEMFSRPTVFKLTKAMEPFQYHYFCCRIPTLCRELTWSQKDLAWQWWCTTPPGPLCHLFAELLMTYCKSQGAMGYSLKTTALS